LKKTDIIFWIFLISVALFYIFKGNDMYQEKQELRDKVFEKNTTPSKDIVDTTK